MVDVDTGVVVEVARKVGLGSGSSRSGGSSSGRSGGRAGGGGC